MHGLLQPKKNKEVGFGNLILNQIFKNYLKMKFQAHWEHTISIVK